MGQGRRKSIRPEVGRYRRRSITQEVENTDSSVITQYLGTAVHCRSRPGSPRLFASRHREPTPYPTVGVSPFSSLSLQSSMPTKARANSASPTNVCQVEESLPVFVKTAPIRYTPNYQIAEVLIRALFPTTTIIQDDRRHELTSDVHDSLHNAMQDLLAEIHSPHTLVNVVSCPEGPVHCVFDGATTHIAMFLVSRCRFERIYGLSVNTAILSSLTHIFPSLEEDAPKALYSILLDFAEAERNQGDHVDDELYIRETDYGQVHRLAELWSTLVSAAYDRFCAFVCRKEQPEIPSVRVLRHAAFVLLRISGVAAKYRPILVSGMAKLLYMEPEGAREMLRVMCAKWPVASPKKVCSWLQLLQDLLEGCSLFMKEDCQEELNRLLRKVLREVNGSHVECGLCALSLVGNDRILVNYIIKRRDRVYLLENCLQTARRNALNA